MKPKGYWPPRDSRAEVLAIREADDDPGYAWEPCEDHPEREAIWKVTGGQRVGELLCDDCAEDVWARQRQRIFAL